MSLFLSQHFGELDYAPEAVFQFPAGIPGFENQREFLFIDQKHTDPLVFMHSMEDRSLCFITLPVAVVCPDYKLELPPDVREQLGLGMKSPQPGTDILCLVIVTVVPAADPTVNLAAPVVLNLHNRLGIQVIPNNSEYGFRHPLPAVEDLALCS